MRRRNITLRGGTITQLQRQTKEMRDKLRAKFQADDELLAKVTQHMIESGWDMDDLVSYDKQASNKHRPAVEAFLFNNDHVIDQLFLQQGTYTGFFDTARDPNYALRHKGQTELIFRRMTPGDLLMMQAGQVHATREQGRRPVDEQFGYWQDIWHEFLFLVLPVGKRNSLRWLWDDLNAAAASSMSFAEKSMKYAEGEVKNLYDAFIDPESPFYVGMVMTWEARREANGFKRGWMIDRVDDRDESRAMAALVLACYGIDNYARATVDGLRTVPHGDSYHSIYEGYLSDLKGKPTYFKEHANGDEETEQLSERDGFLGLRSVFGSRQD